MPVLVFLPIWAAIFAFTLEPPSRGANDPLTLGKALFDGNCATCHGNQGEGGVGPELNNGAVLKTFPDYKDHIKWVTLGSAKWPDPTYGAQNKPVKGGMPSWGDQLSADQITLVVRYEREVLSGEAPNPELVAATEQAVADGATAK
jgi:mono/diheme cytochrome c family protein